MAKLRTILAFPVGLLALGGYYFVNEGWPHIGDAATSEQASDAVARKRGASFEVALAQRPTLDPPPTRGRTVPARPEEPAAEIAFAVDNPPSGVNRAVEAERQEAPSDGKSDNAAVAVADVEPAASDADAAALVADAGPSPAAPSPVIEGPATMETVRAAIRARDFEHAAKLLLSDSLISEPEARYLLATLYRKGDGVPRDDKRAFELMSSAAEAGHLEAEFSLARMYLSGRGVDEDRGQAQIWLARAAEQGHVGATEALVLLMAQAMPLPAAELEPEPQKQTRIAASDIAAKQGKPAMIEAAERGEIRTLERLLAASETPDIRDANGRTPLMLAARGGHLKAVELLLAAGAQPQATDATGKSPLMYAAEAGQAAVARLPDLADGGHRDSDGRTAADLAMLKGHCALGTSLFNGTQVLAPAVEAAIIESCDATQLAQLAEAGLKLTEIDERGRSAVWYAARAGNLDAVEFLIEHGYQIETDNRISPLLVAVNSAYEAVAKRLIEGGADIEAETSSGNTPLMIAATRGLASVSEALIAGGAELDHRNRDGYSALMLAAKYGREEIAQLLVTNGADAGLRNVKRERAADIADASGYTRIAALLQ